MARPIATTYSCNDTSPDRLHQELPGRFNRVQTFLREFATDVKRGRPHELAGYVDDLTPTVMELTDIIDTWKVIHFARALQAQCDEVYDFNIWDDSTIEAEEFNSMLTVLLYAEHQLIALTARQHDGGDPLLADAMETLRKQCHTLIALLNSLANNHLGNTLQDALHSRDLLRRIHDWINDNDNRASSERSVEYTPAHPTNNSSFTPNKHTMEEQEKTSAEVQTHIDTQFKDNHGLIINGPVSNLIICPDGKNGYRILQDIVAEPAQAAEAPSVSPKGGVTRAAEASSQTMPGTQATSLPVPAEEPHEVTPTLTPEELQRVQKVFGTGSDLLSEKLALMVQEYCQQKQHYLYLLIVCIAHGLLHPKVSVAAFVAAIGAWHLIDLSDEKEASRYAGAINELWHNLGREYRYQDWKSNPQEPFKTAYLLCQQMSILLGPCIPYRF